MSSVHFIVLSFLLPVSCSKIESESNDSFLSFVEFSNVLNSDRSFDGTPSFEPLI